MSDSAPRQSEGWSNDSIAAVARALDVDPHTVRADTPLTAVGWTGVASEWVLVAEHAGWKLTVDPPAGVEPSTIGELLAIVESLCRT